MKTAITIVREASAQAPFVLRGDFENSIAQAARSGFEAVELHLAEAAQANAQAIDQACRQARIQVSSIGTGLAFLRDGITLSSAAAEVREQAIERILGFIDLASELDCVVIIGLIKGTIALNGARDDYFRQLTASLDRCLAHASERGVTLVLEAVNRYESDCLNTLAQCVEFIKGFDTPFFKLHIDTFHMNTEEDHIGANIEAAGRYIGHVHIADSNRLYPGAGHYDFVETLAALKRVDYRGALSVECLPWPSPLEAAERAGSYLREAIDNLQRQGAR